MSPEERLRLERSLGYTFRDPSLLVTALTHRSHSHEQDRGDDRDYERLEFLGDALLGFLVAEWLFEDDPVNPEGVLSRRRQTVVRTETLAAISRRLGLGGAIRLGRGEELSGGRVKPALLADLFEAVLAAIYLDGGVDPARTFVVTHLAFALHAVRGQKEAARSDRTGAGNGDRKGNCEGGVCIRHFLQLRMIIKF